MAFRGDRLRDGRISLGLSQSEFGEQIDASQNQIQRWENGATEPNAQNITRMAQVLGWTTDYLLDLVNEPSAQVSESDLSDDERRIINAFRSGKMSEFFRIIGTVIDKKH